MGQDIYKKEKRITCFLPKGSGIKIVEMLHVEKHIDSTNVHSGRGLRTVENVSDYGAWSEQDILTVIVDANHAEEIFEYIFFQGELNKPGGGFIFQADIKRSTSFSLPGIEGSE
jgi:nitrogen regulatory protein PII